jgi:hypothetical protein
MARAKVIKEIVLNSDTEGDQPTVAVENTTQSSNANEIEPVLPQPLTKVTPPTKADANTADTVPGDAPPPPKKKRAPKRKIAAAKLDAEGEQEVGGNKVEAEMETKRLKAEADDRKMEEKVRKILAVEFKSKGYASYKPKKASQIIRSKTRGEPKYVAAEKDDTSIETASLQDDDEEDYSSDDDDGIDEVEQSPLYKRSQKPVLWNNKQQQQQQVANEEPKSQRELDAERLFKQMFRR